MANPATGAISSIEDFRAHVARSALKADPLDPLDYPWVDMPWLEVPPALDVSGDNLQIEDQLTIGSCVSNATTTACERVKFEGQSLKRQLARRYHYFRGRSVSPATAPPKDGGMTLKAGMQAGKSWGICFEESCPYDIAHYNDPPTQAMDDEAAQHKIAEYRRIKGDPYQDIALTFRRIKEALTLGYGVLVGMALEEDFFGLKGPCNGRPYTYRGLAKAGAVSVGGHCMSMDSYALRGALDYLGVSNSWGTVWGDNGRALLASTVLCGSDSFDVWAIKTFDGIASIDPAQQQADTFISRLYVALFGRAPDVDGLAYWTQLYVGGTPLAYIANIMYGTDPARAYYPTFLTNQEIAAAFYVNVLGRQPDAEGLAYWSAQLNTRDIGSVLWDMVYTTANYVGADAAVCDSSDRFNRKVRAGRIYAEKGGDAAGAHDAIAKVN